MTLKTEKEIFIPNSSFRKPVLFLIFKRPGTTQQVFSAIREVKPPRLYVAANSPRSENHEEKNHKSRRRKSENPEKKSENFRNPENPEQIQQI